MATFFTKNEITEKNNILLVVTIILLLILALFFMLKFDNLLGILSCLGCIIIAGVSTIIFVS